MTRIIKVLAAIAAVLMLFGTFFKLSHLAGANVIIITGASAGILLFLLMVYSFTGKLSSGFEQFNGIFISIALIVSLLAFMFKLLHWPGAGKLIWISDIGILLSGAFFLIDGIGDKELPKSYLKIIAGFLTLLLGIALILVG